MCIIYNNLTVYKNELKPTFRSVPMWQCYLNSFLNNNNNNNNNSNNSNNNNNVFILTGIRQKGFLSSALKMNWISFTW